MKQNLLCTFKQLQLALEQYGKVQLKELDLSTTQGMVLYYLLTQKGRRLCAVDLHTALGLSKSAVSSTLKGLRQKGYLDVEVDPADDRKKRIVLTAKARQVEAALDAGLERQQRELCADIPDQHKAWLEDDLRTICRTIQNKMRLEENIHVENTFGAGKGV